MAAVMEMYAHAERSFDHLLGDEGAAAVEAIRRALAAGESATAALSRNLKPTERTLAEVPLASEERSVSLSTVRRLSSIAIRLHLRDQDAEACRYVAHVRGLLKALLERGEASSRRERMRLPEEFASGAAFTNRVTLMITNISTVILTNYVTERGGRTGGEPGAAEVRRLTLTNVRTENRDAPDSGSAPIVILTNYVTRTNVTSITVTNEAFPFHGEGPGADASCSASAGQGPNGSGQTTTKDLGSSTARRASEGGASRTVDAGSVGATNWIFLMKTNRVTLTNWVDAARFPSIAQRGSTAPAQVVFITNRVTITNRITSADSSVLARLPAPVERPEGTPVVHVFLTNRVALTNRVSLTNWVFATNRVHVTNYVTVLNGAVVSNVERVYEDRLSVHSPTAEASGAPWAFKGTWAAFFALALAAVGIAYTLGSRRRGGGKRSGPARY